VACSAGVRRTTPEWEERTWAYNPVQWTCEIAIPELRLARSSDRAHRRDDATGKGAHPPGPGFEAIAERDDTAGLAAQTASGTKKRMWRIAVVLQPSPERRATLGTGFSMSSARSRVLEENEAQGYDVQNLPREIQGCGSGDQMCRGLQGDRTGDRPPHESGRSHDGFTPIRAAREAGQPRHRTARPKS